MIKQPVSQKDVEYVGLRLNQADKSTKKVIALWFEREPAAAKQVIHEITRLIDLAKSMPVTAGDMLFRQECNELVVLSLMHGEVREMLEAVVCLEWDQIRFNFIHSVAKTLAEERIDTLIDRLAMRAICYDWPDFKPLTKSVSRRPEVSI